MAGRQSPLVRVAVNTVVKRLEKVNGKEEVRESRVKERLGGGGGG